MSDQEVMNLLPTIDNSPLSADDDWYDVVDALDNLKAQWKEVGMRLHIPPSKVSEIADNNPKNNAECLSQMLLEWLNKNYNTTKFGEPTWRSLANAVWKLNRAVFRSIAQDHKLQGHMNGANVGIIPVAAPRAVGEAVLQQRPVMAKLGLVKTKTPDGTIKRVRLMDSTANKWKEIGRAMGIQEFTLEGWEDQYAKNSDRINAVFSMFMGNGSPEYPFTYAGIIELLDDVGGFENLTKDFKDVLIAS